MPELDDFEQTLVNQWSEVHKKSALVHLIMTALSDGPKWSAELQQFIEHVTNGEWGVDDRSLYRALRRLEHGELVKHSKEAVPGTGAKRKMFEITASGRRVLETYEQTTLAYLERLDQFREHRSPASMTRPK